MLSAVEARRVLVAVEPGLAAPLRSHFGQAFFAGWEPVEADSLEQTRFLLQHQFFDVLLIDQTLWPGFQDAIWLSRQFQVPVVLLVHDHLPQETAGLEPGMRQWLPAAMAIKHPWLLAGALSQAGELTELRRHTRHTDRALQHSLRQVDQLVGMLWRALNSNIEAGWLAQRHLLDRLRQEINRARRYGEPLTIVLGQLERPTDSGLEPIGDWLAERIVAAKRSCDLAGQYGPRGFLVILVNTPEAGGQNFAERVAKALAQPAGSNGPFLKPEQFVLGIASLSNEAATCTRLLSLAEQQLEATRTNAGLGVETPV
jgi:GGDEF domain-containing protein